MSTRAYWKGFPLGDFRKSPESFGIESTKPQWQEGVGAAQAFGWSNGANVRFQCTVEVAFKRGYTITESSSQFWDRIRTWLKTWPTVLSYGVGNPQAGPLSIVRDVDGSTTGERDATESMGVISAGYAVVITVATPVNWSGGGYVIIADQTDPTKYEIASCSSTNFGAGTLTIAVLAQSYSNIVDICRLEWYWPECALASRIDLPVNGPAGVGFVRDIKLVFEGTEDPVNGGLS